MDQVKCLKAVFHIFYLAHSWIICPKQKLFTKSKPKKETLTVDWSMKTC